MKKVSTPLYEPKTVHLNVNSPFAVKEKFEIKLYESENSNLLHYSKIDQSQPLKMPLFISSTYFQKRKLV